MPLWHMHWLSACLVLPARGAVCAAHPTPKLVPIQARHSQSLHQPSWSNPVGCGHQRAAGRLAHPQRRPSELRGWPRHSRSRPMRACAQAGMCPRAIWLQHSPQGCLRGAWALAAGNRVSTVEDSYLSSLHGRLVCVDVSMLPRVPVWRGLGPASWAQAVRVPWHRTRGAVGAQQVAWPAAREHSPALAPSNPLPAPSLLRTSPQHQPTDLHTRPDPHKERQEPSASGSGAGRTCFYRLPA